MTDQHVPHATITEDGTHLTIVDAASHTTRLALDIDIANGDNRYYLYQSICSAELP